MARRHRLRRVTTPLNRAQVHSVSRQKRLAMIARHWRGWTKSGDADAYEALLLSAVLPPLRKISGYCGGYVLRSEVGEETEFVVINLFDSLEAVKQFAGEDYTVAVFEPEARKLLSKVEPLAKHYDVRTDPGNS